MILPIFASGSKTYGRTCPEIAIYSRGQWFGLNANNGAVGQPNAIFASYREVRVSIRIIKSKNIY
jgi:hypothetical protein